MRFHGRSFSDQREALVSKQSWYQAGYRANIVAYTVAKLANDFDSRGKSFDFRPIWASQSVPAFLLNSLESVAKSVFDILTDPSRSVTNVAEYAKRESVWGIVKDLHVLWPPEMSQLRIDGETRIKQRRGARKDQVLVDGIDAQSRVVNAGGELWNSVLNWGVVNGRLSGKDQDILRVASAIPV